jgi:glycosyltransferase involved in cell wall biosynthesis
MISVIIPTYKEPDVLDVCLKSAIQGQMEKNQIIVVVDGYYDLNKEVLEKYSDDIEVLNLEDNVGLARATNLGVYNAKHDLILIVNDDNVFPMSWDTGLLSSYIPNTVIAPNQIEPIPSMFEQFHIANLGRDPKTFKLRTFWDYEISVSRNVQETTGSTLPIFMAKKDYMKVGGWDVDYPGAWVVDWDFFLKCSLAGLNMIRDYKTHFYHFVSVGTEATTEEQISKREKEVACHEFAMYKWGTNIKHHNKTNLKYL